MKYFFLLTLTCLLIGCDTSAQTTTTWPEIETRLEQLNSKYRFSQVDVANIPQGERQKLLEMTKEELDRFFDDLEQQQAEDNERLSALGTAQEERATYFEQQILPKLMEAESKEKYHQIILDNQEYCSPDMVDRAKKWFVEKAGDPKGN